MEQEEEGGGEGMEVDAAAPMDSMVDGKATQRLPPRPKSAYAWLLVGPWAMQGRQAVGVMEVMQVFG